MLFPGWFCCVNTVPNGRPIVGGLVRLTTRLDHAVCVYQRVNKNRFKFIDKLYRGHSIFPCTDLLWNSFSMD
jgi:hypothetical protein